MFEKELNNRIEVIKSAENWEEAINIAAKSLLDEEVVERKYVDKIKSNVNEIGTYFVVDHDIVLAHARPEDGVNENGLSFLKLQEGVEFPGQEGKKLDLIFVLSAIDKKNHMTWLSKFSKAMDDVEMIKKIRATENKEEIINILQNKINN